MFEIAGGNNLPSIEHSSIKKEVSDLLEKADLEEIITVLFHKHVEKSGFEIGDSIEHKEYSHKKGVLKEIRPFLWTLQNGAFFLDPSKIDFELRFKSDEQGYHQFNIRNLKKEEK